MSPSNRAFVQLALLGLLCRHALASGKTSMKTREVVVAPNGEILFERAGMVRRGLLETIHDEQSLIGVAKQAKRLGLHVAAITRAERCLQLTTPSLNISYPDDAETHFEEINKVLTTLANGSKPHCYANYCGPWIENYFIEHARSLWSREQKNLQVNARLSNVFGPYIPLLFPFVDNQVGHWKTYLKLDAVLKGLLRSDVAYVAVSQSDRGLSDLKELTKMPNLLVLSAGGYGHIPVPLLKQEEAIATTKPMKERSLFGSFLGTLSAGHDPSGLRTRLQSLLSDKNNEHHDMFAGRAPDWKEKMGDSRVSFAPRGYGRTAFHLAEIVQMGLVPVHVYSTIPWVPYADLYKKSRFHGQW